MNRSIKSLRNLLLTLALLTAIPAAAITQADQPDQYDKKVKHIKTVTLNDLARIFEVNQADLNLLIVELEDARDAAILTVEKELDLRLNQEALAVLGISEGLEASKIDTWMLAPSYFDESYENSRIEDWMLTELEPAEEEPALKPWMFDTDYYNK